MLKRFRYAALGRPSPLVMVRLEWLRMVGAAKKARGA